MPFLKGFEFDASSQYVIINMLYTNKEFYMKITQLDNKKVKYTFTVTSHELDHGLDHAFDHQVKEVEIKGFRKGHVPRKVFESKFGIEVLYEDAINHVLHHKYQDVMADTTYTIVSDPEIDVDFSKIKQGEPFDISLIFDVKPEVTLGNYKGVKATYLKSIITDQDVDLEIEHMLKRDGTLEPKEEGELLVGDTAIFDFEGFLNDVPFDGGKAENYELEIGSNQFIPGFEEQMVGMLPGESKDLHVTFPENYQADNLKGQAVVFKVTLHDIKTKVAVEFNDAWVDTLKREEKTVDQLKAALKKELQDKKDNQATSNFNNHVLTQVMEDAQVEIPQSMIDKEAQGYIDNIKQQAKQYNIEYEQFLQFSGMTIETFEAQSKKDAAERVKTNLVFEAIAKAETLVPSEERIEEEYKKLAEQHKLTVDYVKQVLPKETIQNDLSAQLGYDFVLEHAIKQ
jgi:trigger factor